MGKSVLLLVGSGWHVVHLVRVRERWGLDGSGGGWGDLGGDNGWGSCGVV